MDSYIREACVSNLQDALAAEKNGADQIELCSHLEWDGLSPDITLLEDLLDHLNIPIKVMVRHRKGDFVYDAQDIEQLLSQIEAFKKYPIAGVVLGAINQQGLLDLPLIKTLCHAALPISVTLHKCIDLVDDPFLAFAELKTISNLDFVLSSGGSDTAWVGRHQLKEMQAALESEIKVIAAGKITAANLSQHHATIGASHYHGKLIV